MHWGFLIINQLFPPSVGLWNCSRLWSKPWLERVCYWNAICAIAKLFSLPYLWKESEIVVSGFLLQQPQFSPSNFLNLTPGLLFEECSWERQQLLCLQHQSWAGDQNQGDVQGSPLSPRTQGRTHIPGSGAVLRPIWKWGWLLWVNCQSSPSYNSVDIFWFRKKKLFLDIIFLPFYEYKHIRYVYVSMSSYNMIIVNNTVIQVVLLVIFYENILETD